MVYQRRYSYEYLRDATQEQEKNPTGFFEMRRRSRRRIQQDSSSTGMGPSPYIGERVFPYPQKNYEYITLSEW